LSLDRGEQGRGLVSWAKSDAESCLVIEAVWIEKLSGSRSLTCREPNRRSGDRLDLTCEKQICINLLTHFSHRLGRL
jgi:hypothetical protein